MYFERAIPAMEKAGAPSQAPAGFADMLDEYAIALRNVHRDAEANSVQARANKLRTDYPQGHSITDRTPYGTQCCKGRAIK
jgi:hypothetical protein